MTDLHGRHALIVDDDPDMRAALRVVLEAAGCGVDEAATAAEGLEAAARTCPSLILADLMMEEVNSGVDMVRVLRERGCVCPVFLLSSAADTVKHNIRPGDYGLDGLLQKPVAPETLLETVRRAFGAAPA